MLESWMKFWVIIRSNKTKVFGYVDESNTSYGTIPMFINPIVFDPKINMFEVTLKGKNQVAP